MIETFATYPFLPESGAFMAKHAPPVEELLTDRKWQSVRELGALRLEQSIKEARIDINIQRPSEVLFSYFFARLLVSALSDRYVVRRFALAEAVRVRDALLRDRRIVPKVGKCFEFEFVPVEGEYEWSLHFAEYLKVSVLINDIHWKLATQPLQRGRVFMTTHRASRIVQEAIRLRIESELPKKLDAETVEAVEPYLDRLREIIAETRPDIETPTEGSSSALFPPCMNHIIDMLKAGGNAPHHARFAVAAFLITAGVSQEETCKAFQNAPDYSPEITKKQVASVAKGKRGTPYTPPDCARMRSGGLCFPDSLCHSKKPGGEPRITNPMAYLRYQQWKAGVDS